MGTVPALGLASGEAGARSNMNNSSILRREWKLERR
jgi:hypothetical protein